MGLRTTAFAVLAALVVEYALGAAVTLAGASRPLVAVHIILGLLLILAALAFLVRAALARAASSITLGALGLLSILAAASAGFRFVDGGGSAVVMQMALAAGVAMLAYATALLLAPRPA